MDEYRKVMDGPHCELWISSSVEQALEDAQANHKRRIERTFEQICLDGGKAPSQEQFKHEGKFADGTKGGTKKTVYALKAHQLRIYGGFARGRFYCCEATIKKQNKASKKQKQ